MFQMMNSARIDVGMKGASLSTAGYLSSLNMLKASRKKNKLIEINIESDQVI